MNQKSESCRTFCLVLMLLPLMLVACQKASSDETEDSPISINKSNINKSKPAAVTQNQKPGKSTEMTTESNQPERKPNRLIKETSPYLLQHAYNPVDWYPWGEEAFAKAKELNRPIFLSIGYSACHWCHVMEHESFENEKIAAYMNEHFICIKVDREERPDVDQIYMNSVVALSGHGGWPMSVFLRPDLKPFFGGTYWPPVDSRGMPGFLRIMEMLNDAWHNRREDVDKNAEQLTNAVITMSSPDLEQATLKQEILHNAMGTLLNAADLRDGGFGTAPKFPHAMDLRFLLRCAKRFESKEALQVATLAFDKMAYGGMYDQLGGGFHRYSTDARWLVPHFEKMLYDNALLTTAYVEAWQLTNNPEYERIVRETLEYVQREMTHPEGGFFSTQDADSEGVEGKFFVWSKEEIIQILRESEAALFNACYDVSAHGNWEETNILNRPRNWETVAKEQVIDLKELHSQIAASRQKLFAEREKRIHPGRDEKILASWNGLMIAAFAQAGMALQEPDYIDSARRAADFTWNHMRNEQGRVLHSWKEGELKFNGYLDDYANLIDAYVEVYQATSDVAYLERASALTEIMLEHFSDQQVGGFFYTSNDHEKLIARPKESQDNATPSGNAMAATVLYKLGRITGETELEEVAYKTLQSLSGQLESSSMSSAQSLIAFDFQTGPTWELVLVSEGEEEAVSGYLEQIHRKFIPNKVVVTHNAAEEIAPILQTTLLGKTVRDGKPTLYQCEHGACQAPLNNPEEIEKKLKEL